MKFSAHLAIAGLVASVCSRSVIERDLKIVTRVLSDVQSGIDSVDTAVKSFNGEPAPVISASERLVSTINSGTAVVQGSSDLTLGESFSLLQIVKTLQAHEQTLSDDLNSNRPAIQDAKQCDATRHQITNIKSASQNLINKIVSKVPKGVQELAAERGAAVTKVLDEAQNNFAPGNCNDA